MLFFEFWFLFWFRLLFLCSNIILLIMLFIILTLFFTTSFMILKLCFKTSTITRSLNFKSWYFFSSRKLRAFFLFMFFNVLLMIRIVCSRFDVFLISFITMMLCSMISSTSILRMSLSRLWTRRFEIVAASSIERSRSIFWSHRSILHMIVCFVLVWIDE